MEHHHSTNPSKITFITVALFFFLIGVSTGYFFTPEYQKTLFTAEHNGLGKADALVDLRYIRTMAAHHQGAIELAKQAQQNSTRPEIQALAADILKGEPVLIAELEKWKQDWYKDYRPMPQPRVAQLGQADATFDLRFLNALITHHEAGIEMTQEIRTKSTRADILNNADAVEKFLTTTKGTLSDWRTNWYSTKSE